MISSIKNQQGLFISAIIALLFAVVGLVVGLLVDSQIILFDGLYSFISFGLSLLSLMASNFIKHADHKKYPFGAANLGALVIIFKFSIILILIVSSIAVAVHTIVQGGNLPEFNVALVYAFTSIFVCWFMGVYLKRQAIKKQDALLLAEADQWIFDTISSVSVFVSFLVVVILLRLDMFVSWVVWVDPALVIITGLYLMKTPIQSIIKQTKVILEEAPNQKVMNQLSYIIKDIENKYELEETFLRASMGNGMLWLEIDLVVSSESKVRTIEDQDRIREEINQKIKRIPSKKWLTVSFMKNRKWAL